MTDFKHLRELAEAATPGPWHWAGNTDTGEPYLATWIPGAGRCQVLSIGSADRDPEGPEAKSIRDSMIDCGYSEDDADDYVREWATDSFGSPRRDPRLQFMTDLMCADARDLAIYEVAPDATSREDPKVYRADVVGIRHPDAAYLAAANPQTVIALLDEIERLRGEVEWEYQGIPIYEDGREAVGRPIGECEEWIAEHADPSHWIHEPRNSDLAPVVAYRVERRRPASDWEPSPEGESA
jgi:hypothetical protein